MSEVTNDVEPIAPGQYVCGTCMALFDSEQEREMREHAVNCWGRSRTTTTKACPTCNGKGEYPPDIALPVDHWIRCGQCGGTGVVPVGGDDGAR